MQEREDLSPSLLVLCGDHGMSESGGHGASSLEEVSTALLLTSSAFERKPGEDLDMANMLKLHFTAFFYHLVLILKLFLEAKFEIS